MVLTFRCIRWSNRSVCSQHETAQELPDQQDLQRTSEELDEYEAGRQDYTYAKGTLSTVPFHWVCGEERSYYLADWVAHFIKISS